MNVGIIGSRSRDSIQDFALVLRAFVVIDGDKIIVSGKAKKGGDRFADIICENFGFEMIPHPPEFEKHGIPEAYFKRNTLIAQDSDVLIACVAFDRKGGTEDTIRKFKQFHPNGRLIIV